MYGFHFQVIVCEVYKVEATVKHLCRFVSKLAHGWHVDA